MVVWLVLTGCEWCTKQLLGVVGEDLDHLRWLKLRLSGVVSLQAAVVHHLLDPVGGESAEDPPVEVALDLSGGVPLSRDVFDEVPDAACVGDGALDAELRPGWHREQHDFSLAECELLAIEDILEELQGAILIAGQVDVLHEGVRLRESASRLLTKILSMASYKSRLHRYFLLISRISAAVNLKIAAPGICKLFKRLLI